MAITAAGAWLAAPGAAPAAPPVPSARAMATAACQEERAGAGKAVFRKRYGKRHAMRSCIRRGIPAAREEIAFVGEACAEELAEVGAADFGAYYGTILGGNPGDAMGNCILDGLYLLPEDEWEE